MYSNAKKTSKKKDFCTNFCDGLCKKTMYECPFYHKPCSDSLKCEDPECKIGHMVPYDIRNMIMDMVSKAPVNDCYSDVPWCRFGIICSDESCQCRHNVDYENRVKIRNIIRNFKIIHPNHQNVYKKQVCRYHQQCRDYKCEYYHDVNLETRKKIIAVITEFENNGGNHCKHNLTCSKQNCVYNHDTDYATRLDIIEIVAEYKTTNDMPVPKVFGKPNSEEDNTYWASSAVSEEEKSETKNAEETIVVVDEKECNEPTTYKETVSDFINKMVEFYPNANALDINQIKLLCDKIAHTKSYANICSPSSTTTPPTLNIELSGGDWNDM